MSAFGNQNYATPLGALSPSGFFDASGQGFYSYSGFSSREGFFGFSGYSNISGYSSFCGDAGIEFIPWRPTLVYPRTYSVLQGVVPIFWEPARPPDVCGDDVTYTIQFTRTFSQNTGWRTIAENITSSTNSFDFDVSEIPFTEDGGIRIRARDSNNLVSQWSTNIEAFTLKNHAPSAVTLLAPLGRETFDNYILIIWKEAQTKDLDGHEVFYKIEVTSRFSDNEGWIVPPGGEALTEGTTSFTINSFDFPEGDNYGVRVTAIDEMGAESDPKSAGGLKIRHSGNLIIDTIAPDGTITINDGDALANDRRVKLTLFAEDNTTGIKDVRFKNEGEECWGDWDTFTHEKFWDLTSGDGIKRIFVQYRDYAGNVSEVCDCEIVSRVLCDEGNATDIDVFNDKLYIAFDANGRLVEYRVLVRTAAELEEPQLTAITHMDNNLYVASYDPVAGESSIYRYDGTAYKITIVGTSKILSMAAYNSKIYMGLEDGRIMELSGTSLSTSYTAGNSVTRLVTDDSVLFAAISSGGRYLAFDGATWKVNLA